ncbi:MAG: serine hydrolase domain-containing protein [Lysobacterales bacterium]
MTLSSDWWPRLGLLSALLGCPSAAFGTTELPASLRQPIEAGIANGRFQGVAIGLIDHASRDSWFLGATRPDGASPLGDDAYEIGAVTRAFTGLLLARAISEGRIGRGTTLAQAFDKVRFADRALSMRSIEQLATQTAGLPELPPNLFPADIDDPYADFDDGKLQSMLTHLQAVAPAGTYRYSDLGEALLAAALGRAYKDDYRKVLAHEVLAPLGLHGTGFGSVPHLLTGFRDGEPALHWQHEAMAGAEGLRSTLPDLLALVAAQLRPSASSLANALVTTRAQLATAGGGATTLGWQVVMVQSGTQSWPLMWQAGITGGFAAFVGWRSDLQQGLVLLGNSGCDLSAIGIAFLSGLAPPAAPRRLLRLDDATRAEFAGLYQFDGGGEFIVRDRGGRLAGQESGHLPVPLRAFDDDAFEYGPDAQLTFQRQTGTVMAMTLHRGGMNIRAERLSLKAPVLVRTTSPLAAGRLAEYAGEYRLTDALRARVRPDGGGVSLQLTGNTRWLAMSCGEDRFCDSSGVLEVTFHRDAARRVTAIDWQQGLFTASGPRDDW